MSCVAAIWISQHRLKMEVLQPDLLSEPLMVGWPSMLHNTAPWTAFSGAMRQSCCGMIMSSLMPHCLGVQIGPSSVSEHTKHFSSAISSINKFSLSSSSLHQIRLSFLSPTLHRTNLDHATCYFEIIQKWLTFEKFSNAHENWDKHHLDLVAPY